MPEIKGAVFAPVDFDPFLDTSIVTLPLTAQQSEVWVESQMGPEANCAFNQCFVLHLQGPLSVGSMQNALDQVVRRHAALRARFDKEGNKQQILPQGDVKIAFEDVSGLGERQRRDAIEQIVDRETGEPFDLANGPLVRAKVIREAADLYRLILTAHHIVCDGWSSSVLFSELAAIYSADRFGLEARLAEPMSYQQYVTSALGQNDAVADEAFWLKRLAGELPNLDLPLDQKRPAMRSRNGDRQTLRIESNLYKQIKRLGASRGATLFHTLLAAFEVLIFRLSGQDDLILGIPIARQSELENGHLVAHCVATLPLRCRVDPTLTFTQFLNELRTTFLEGQAHPNITFSSLLPKLNIRRDASRPALISVVFNIDRIGSAFDFGELSLKQVETPKRFVTFDLNVNVVDSGHDLLVECDYNSDILQADTIRRWLGHMSTLLGAIVRDVEQPIGRIDILGAEEPHSPANIPAVTADAYNVAPLHRLFETRVRETMDAEAVVAGKERLTYGELNVRANRLAHALRQKGVRRNDIIGLAVERNADLAIGILAILKAGAAYLPLDPDYPRDRLAFVVVDAKVGFVLASSNVTGSLQLESVECLDIATAGTGFPDTDPDAASVPQDLAYVIYTSGSTGKPKGVLVTHANVTRLFSATDLWFAFGPHDTWTLFHSYAFDFTVWELWGALLYGGRLVIVPHWITRDPFAFRKLLVDERVTILNQTPSALRQLIQADLEEAPAPYALRAVIFGGEALELQSLKPWIERYGDAKPRLINLYGPTEATVFVTYRPITRADLEAGRGSVIGRPVPDVYIRLLDERGEPVPIGVPGEIWVGGAGVANGYLNRPELTAQRFVSDPFDSSHSARLYRTGDLARKLPDGDLEFLGRIDSQVKIHGFRIELGEIEAALAACPGVSDAAVIAREDTPGEKRIVAYVVADSKSGGFVEQLVSTLSGQLPGYMVPAQFVLLPALPLNNNGKLDRSALPVPDSAPLPIAHRMDLPRSQTEEAIAAIWQQVLKRAAVDRAEDFFRIGGHSLLATQVASRIRDVFQVELPVALLFQHRTVQSLAHHVDNQLRDKYRAEPMPPIEPRASDAPARLSASQERMWLIHELAPDNRAYNIPIALELSGQLDIDALERAIDVLRQRHEALRTTYLLDGPHPVQIVQPWNRQPLEIADLRRLGEGALKEALVQATAHAGKTFDLARDAPMRTVLFRLGDQHHLLVMTAHHIALDDWGFGLLTVDLATAYNNLHAGRPAGLDPLALKYSDYAAWQRRWLETHSERQLAYWRTELDGIVPLELPTDKPRPDVFGFRGRVYLQPFSDELHDRLTQLGHREGSTLFMTTLTAYAVLLHRWTGQTDFTIAVPIANRTHTSTEKLVGTFVNTLVIRVDLDGRPSLREALRRVRTIALEAYAHQDAPFEELAKELVRNRDTSRPPLAQVIFNLLNTPAHGMQWDGLNWQVHDLDLGAAQFEIGLSIDTTLSHTLSVGFNSDLFEDSTIVRFVDQYMRVLSCLLTDLDMGVDDIPLLTVAEQDQVLRSWNRTSSSYPSETPFNRLFEDTVRQNPEAIAVSLGGEALTYAELNAKANRLAHLLIRHGAQRGVVVGLCLNRSLDLLISLLAIQKSGAAYVPLDPGFPAERLAYMLQDSGASLLLTGGDAAAGIERPDHVTILDLDRQELDNLSFDDPASAPGADDPAYLIYTSGSTGRPKGVAVSHRALVNFLCSMQREPGLASTDVLAAVTTISFDIAGLELYLPLMVGARVELVPRETAADADLLARLLDASGATVLQATPATWRMLIEAGWSGSDRLRALCGGEALSSDLAEALLPRVKELWNLYGPTETTIWSSVGRVEPEDRVLSIGRPIANTQIYVVDKSGKPVSVGVAGEIWIGGDGVAIGYHRRPELTAERFVHDRFSDRPGGRLYRTGDLGRWLPDGRLQHLGRIDSQVKIRGFRIELGEIEAALNAHPMVRQSAVVTREARPGDVRIVAYIVVNGGEDLTVSEVRRYLRATLPDYMIPSFVVTLQSLPLTANGKLDRAGLPDVFRSVGKDVALSEPPAPGTEQLLAEIWRDILRVDEVNAGDNFFDLGGHSLLAIRVAVALQRQIGWRMDPRSLFFQTLRQVAAQAEAAATRPPATERIA
jgi:amino acid adenylation domain-containing protein